MVKPLQQAIEAVDAAGEIVALGIFALKVLGWSIGVLLLSVVGWAASSLHVLAAWPGSALAGRLEILRGIVASVLAGGVTALAGLHYETPAVLILIGVLLAGYSGERWLRPLAEEVVNRVRGAIGGSRSGQP